METIELTSLSSKGQIVIPQKIRESMNLKIGEKFIVLHEGDTIVLKSLEVPSFKNFNKLISKAIKFAKDKNLTTKDLDEAIKSVRKK